MLRREAVRAHTPWHVQGKHQVVVGTEDRAGTRKVSWESSDHFPYGECSKAGRNNGRKVGSKEGSSGNCLFCCLVITDGALNVWPKKGYFVCVW